MSDYGKRADGTAKGSGFFGELKRPDGTVSTEISVGVNLGGKEREIPLMVPTLNKAELSYLLNNDPQSPQFLKNMPDSIFDKAVSHAGARLSANQSPFAVTGETYNAPNE